MPPERIQAEEFRRALLEWYRQAHRKLPWRDTTDPYRIWLSEIMLQQTRVAAALPYYQRFLERFPTVGALAEASEQALLAAWSGLGYYTRARNMRKAARQVMQAGEFPRTHEGIRRLPGIGDYTAAAIASISFNLPHAVLDGNVLRVISRLTNDSGDIQSTTVRRRMREEAHRLLAPASPAAFNQAMMELGALICLPRAPQCLLCPVAPHCQARAKGTQAQLPVKLRKTEPVFIEKALLLIERDGTILLRQRSAENRLMAGFWELPEREELPQVELTGPPLGQFRHSITHHNLTFTVLPASLQEVVEGYQRIALASLPGLAVSTVTRKALRLLHKVP